jgi:hypothetical protein
MVQALKQHGASIAGPKSTVMKGFMGVLARAEPPGAQAVLTSQAVGKGVLACSTGLEPCAHGCIYEHQRLVVAKLEKEASGSSPNRVRTTALLVRHFVGQLTPPASPGGLMFGADVRSLDAMQKLTAICSTLRANRSRRL